MQGVIKFCAFIHCSFSADGEGAGCEPNASTLAFRRHFKLGQHLLFLPHQCYANSSVVYAKQKKVALRKIDPMNRKRFLETIIGASAFATLPYSAIANDPLAARHLLKEVEKSANGSMVGFAADPIQKVRIGIIGMGNRGSSLLEMLQLMIENGSAEIAAFADINPKKLTKASEKLSQWQKSKPKTYGKTERDWENLVKQDDVDLVLVTTPWEWHTEMALFSMNNGKHVATEVPMSYSMSDCWEIIATAERAKKHCIMLENCCYTA